MDITTGLILIGVIHCVLLFFDNFFKTCCHYPYLKFLEGTGFEINFLSIKWKTKAFNRLIIRWGNRGWAWGCFLHLWFTLGLLVTLMLLPISIFLLLYSLVQNVFYTDSEAKVIIEPIVLGVNLPTSELGYYSLTLVLCSVVHEFGHALAAVVDEVHLIDTGVNIFYILPVAYVNLSTEKFSSISRKKVLKILCAGIWHNLVLSLLAYSIYQSLPSIFSSFYQLNKGVTITNMVKTSPLLGPRGLDVRDTIYRINECDIYNEKTWHDCLQSLQYQKQALCIESDLVHSLDESIPLKQLESGDMECCDRTKSKNLCFEYLDTADRVLQFPTHVCLPGRTVVEKSPKSCGLDDHTCPEGFHCFRPILTNGSASDIYRTIEISPYIPIAYFTTTTVADVGTKFIKYVAVISLGLAFINMIPFAYMDGQHIVDILGLVLLRRSFGKTRARLITGIITWCFTLILIIQCLVTVSKVLF